MRAGRERARERSRPAASYDLQLEYFEDVRDAEVRLGWRLPGAGAPFEEAVAAARAADVVVFVGGLTAEVEGEEMRVSYPGFAGGDRTDIELPAIQQKLLEALHATGKPVVLVLTTGLGARPALGAGRTCPRSSWPGTRASAAATRVADVLFGDYNPAGRLPVTFYESVAELPPFADYAMEGRTYRYFRGEPLYPFGHGLSYTRFEYSGLSLSRARVGAGDARRGGARRQEHRRAATATRWCSSTCATSVATAPAPVRELRGFERVASRPASSAACASRSFPSATWRATTRRGRRFAVEPGEFEVELGASSARPAPARAG